MKDVKYARQLNYLVQYQINHLFQEENLMFSCANKECDVTILKQERKTFIRSGA